MVADSGIAGLGHSLHGAVRAIVLEGLTRGVGQSLSTNVEYKSRLGLGAGTMQRALDLLRDRGALTVVSRGHLGRFVETLDVGQSWQAAGLAPVRLLLPPLGPLEIDVLAAELADGLTDLGVASTVHQLRGASGRLEALRSGGHDLAVVSAGTWETQARAARDQGPPTEAVRTLAAGTYYAPRRLVAVHRNGESRSSFRRVAIDRASPDHVTLTTREFPEAEGFEHVDAPFPSVPEWVLRGRFDVGIWHLSQSVIPLDLAGLAVADLERPATMEVWAALSGAALVGARSRPELRSVMEALPLADLRVRQQAALDASAHDSTEAARGATH